MNPLAVATLFSVTPLAILQAGPSAIKLGPLQKAEMISGCGLAISLPSANGPEWPQIFGYCSNNEDGFIRVNGQLHRLRMKEFKQAHRKSRGSAI